MIRENNQNTIPVSSFTYFFNLYLIEIVTMTEPPMDPVFFCESSPMKTKICS